MVKSTLSFTGTVKEAITAHAKSGQPTITTVDTFEYDHANRLLSQSQNINSATDDELIVEHHYDELGQLESKGVGGRTTQGRLQNVNYTYNVRGWLKQINDPASLGNDLFSFKINYNTVGHSGTKLYNGNISETEWRTANTDNSLKWYRYGYDPLNRITSGISGSSNSSWNNKHSLKLVEYDKNGNITKLRRNGYLTNNTFDEYLDHLTYTYDGNKLTDILEEGHHHQRFEDHLNTQSGNDYTYDANGNMTSDANKGITSITYNHLNLPTSVSIGNGNISYIYDATGVKLKKTVSTGTTTEYAGNYVYEDTGSGSSLKFFNHPEGYVDASGSGYEYVYQYKDHLGNIRLSYSDSDGNGSIDASTEIISEKNYYPFGLLQKGYNNVVTSNANSVAEKFKFGGNELNEELGLNWYDITARNYDPALGRWMNIDPLAEKFVETSPYVYAKNNPIFFVDPNDEEPVPGPFTGKGWRSSNGTITVHRITAGQRYALNVYYSIAVTFGGGAGTAVGIYDSAKIITNPNETTQTRAGVATQLALDGASSFMLTDEAAKGFGEAVDASGKAPDGASMTRTWLPLACS